MELDLEEEEPITDDHSLPGCSSERQQQQDEEEFLQELLCNVLGTSTSCCLVEDGDSSNARALLTDDIFPIVRNEDETTQVDDDINNDKGDEEKCRCRRWGIRDPDNVPSFKYSTQKLTVADDEFIRNNGEEPTSRVITRPGDVKHQKNDKERNDMSSATVPPLPPLSQSTSSGYYSTFLNSTAILKSSNYPAAMPQLNNNKVSHIRQIISKT